MTCLEKYREEHPDISVGNILDELCPHWETCFGYDAVNYCEMHSGSGDCVECWNQPVPGTAPTPTADEPHIRDSGSRTEFSTGAVRDMGGKEKGRCDLMPLDVVANLVGEADGHPDPIITYIDHFQTFGDTGCLYLALERFAGKAFARDSMGTSCCHMCLEVSKHFAEGCEKYGENNWMKGIPLKSYINSGVRHYLKWLRGDKDENHHLAFCWNLMCAIWTCKHKPELNDYGLKDCPVCGETLPREAKFCGNCQVSMMDPDDLMGEYEEENE